ncbi:imidazole glycerol phosphate synthase subunit HisH [Bacteroidia bacterium]|nr:imidazole glycerol phosphate synthase subunit HisH [Bacteroidia bacterium]
MSVAIVKYNAGNICSVQNALRRMGCQSQVTDDPHALQTADKVIFPGVGEASTAMRYLQEHGLDVLIKSLQQPVLGICIGLQLMCRHSQEGDVDGLGIFDAQVKRFESAVHKIPHIGWNTIHNLSSPLFKGINEDTFVYYVHSYYATGTGVIATTNYIHPYAAALHKNNFYAVQFHPEKSADVGETVLKNFLAL